jgi:DNA-binding GntR family transcriptional regulator
MMRELIVEHRQICVAIRNRDPASGQDAMRNHLRAALRKVGQISKDNPTWFMT